MKTIIISIRTNKIKKILGLIKSLDEKLKVWSRDKAYNQPKKSDFLKIDIRK